jgi:plastocyanin domain-containing protein
VLLWFFQKHPETQTSEERNQTVKLDIAQAGYIVNVVKLNGSKAVKITERNTYG